MAYSLILGNLVIDHLFAGINFDARDIFCIEILPHMVSTKFVYSLPKWIKQVLLYYSPYRGDPHIGKFVPDFVDFKVGNKVGFYPSFKAQITLECSRIQAYLFQFLETLSSERQPYGESCLCVTYGSFKTP